MPVISKKPPRSDIPVVLTIAGSDNSGGAGIQADLKTFTSLGVYGTSAITCVVAEHPGRVHSIHAVPAHMVSHQIDLVFEAFPVHAIKTGMLYNGEIIRAIAKSLSTRRNIPLVVDPVMVATSGSPLLRNSAIQLMQDKIFPMATLITPNLDEAALLSGLTIRSLPQLTEAAKRLSQDYGVPFLVKGGHLKSSEAVDILHGGATTITYRAKTVRGVNTHGTGCTYSAAIAAYIAKGLSLNEAVRKAKKYITSAIQNHLRLGPWQALHHMA